jgi:hypothetical protein
MYTPFFSPSRFPQCLCGCARHDMRFTRVFTGFLRCAEMEKEQSPANKPDGLTRKLIAKVFNHNLLQLRSRGSCPRLVSPSPMLRTFGRGGVFPTLGTGSRWRSSRGVRIGLFESPLWREPEPTFPTPTTSGEVPLRPFRAFCCREWTYDC